MRRRQTSQPKQLAFTDVRHESTVEGMQPLPDAVRDTCRQFFGVYTTKRGWSPPNRCDSCPLSTPCKRHSAHQPRSIEDLADSRRTFIAESLQLLGGKP